MQTLHSVYNQGRVAFLHLVGYPNSSLSHFSAQHYWETGIPHDKKEKNGWVTRLISQQQWATGTALLGAGISTKPQRAFVKITAPQTTAHLRAIQGNGLAHGYALSAAPGAPPGTKLRNALDTAFDATGPTAAYGAVVRSTGQLMLDSEQAISGLTPAAPFSATPFGAAAADAMAILTGTTARVVGIEMGGFDTHAYQGGDLGGLNGTHANLLSDLSDVLAAIDSAALAAAASINLVTLVVSEFGRRNEPTSNDSSAGTDHGVGGLAMAIGSSVRGKGISPQDGVFHCDAATWGVGLSSIVTGDNLPYLHDYRAVYGELLQRHFGVPPAGMDVIMPGYAAAQAQNPSAFTFVGYL